MQPKRQPFTRGGAALYLSTEAVRNPVENSMNKRRKPRHGWLAAACKKKGSQRCPGFRPMEPLRVLHPPGPGADQ